MATFRTILNRVLRTVAETEVQASDTSLTDSYHKLVATFLNQIKEEIEEAHTWRDLQQSHTATVLANTQSGTITNATDRSRLIRAYGEDGPAALAFDVTTPSNPIPLTEVPLAELEYRIATDYPGTATEPSMFAIVAGTDETMSIKVYPKPTTTRTITLLMFTPQARLSESTDLDTVVLIPSRPIELGTIWYALMERGEEMGQNSMFTEERYRKALDDAIARDAEEQGGYSLQIV